ncbi:hypothetical protein GCM10009557_02590 [Virgisporangium ochraceum]|uniref:Uncharacterized protein n=1 Tax=Virgisporangium ochraceum TaxID=65505 RepID=A0A8J4A4X9_9ACTN|nr:hypothetical protein Voc01_077330 [Virgisporangium ochraceum]
MAPSSRLASSLKRPVNRSDWQDGSITNVMAGRPCENIQLNALIIYVGATRRQELQNISHVAAGL